MEEAGSVNLAADSFRVLSLNLYDCGGMKRFCRIHKQHVSSYPAPPTPLKKLFSPFPFKLTCEASIALIRGW